MISNTRTKLKAEFVVCSCSLFICGNHGPRIPCGRSSTCGNESRPLISYQKTRITQLTISTNKLDSTVEICNCIAGNPFPVTTHHLTLSTMKKSVMALSNSCAGSSFKEMATAAAISEDLNSKKSIPAMQLNCTTTL